MSHDDHHHSPAPASVPAWQRPLRDGLANEALGEHLVSRFGLVPDSRDRWDLSLVCPRERLREVVLALRDDVVLRFDQLIDVVGIDYLSYPGHRGARFAVVYLFRSTVFRHRVKLKVEVDEDDARVPSLHDFYPIADWAERETWDLVGVDFTGHPNQKRLLTHHEFTGHALRKDYPCQKRQKLSVNDPMMDQLEANLVAKGYRVIDRGEASNAEPMTVTAGA